MATLSRFPDMVANSREVNWAPPHAPRALKKSVLPLELAGNIRDASVSKLVAVSQTTKECAASKMLAAQWGGVFTRRVLPRGATGVSRTPLATTRGVVELARGVALPVAGEGGAELPTPATPPAPRDAEGRSRSRCAKMSSSRPSSPFAATRRCRTGAEGALRIQDVEDLTGNSDSDYWNGVAGPNWLLEIPLETVARTGMSIVT